LNKNYIFFFCLFSKLPKFDFYSPLFVIITL